MDETEKWYLSLVEKSRKLRNKKNEPIKKIAKYPLLGFNSDLQTIKLNENTTIEKVSLNERQDLYGIHNVENEYFLVKKLLEYEYIVVHNFQELPSVMHGISSKLRNDLLALLRITRLACVDIWNIRNYWFDDTSANYNSVGITTYKTGEDYFVHDPYHLIKKDAFKLRKLWKRFSEHNADKALDIALNRFNYSFSRLNLEDKVIDLFISIEAMFGDTGGELSYRISLRMAKFIDIPAEREFVFEFVKKMYGVRSKLVHGASLSKKDLSILGESFSLEEAIWYLYKLIRLALSQYIIDHSGISVSDFRKMIDKEILK
ncbi:hypothetical protein FNH22_24425 [Fulvivirga sp. M361]|uniref:HEPN domain-containing protein n=1 Tax=Fulvivirga sp. M361 TaxID=2594266 RepID=UPI001179C9B4|nr:HEPN domain-containing protein [Fulvivirga sp. M361]TRX51285.1 hypothetical protein FNH22_24425 [Fulvivirga sp. M361]